LIIPRRINTFSPDKWRPIWALVLIGASILLTLGGPLIPGLLGVPLSPSSGRYVVLWPDLHLSVAFAVLSQIPVVFYLLLVRNRNHGSSCPNRIIHILSPLTLLPLSLLGFFFRPYLPSAFSGNFLFFFPLGLIASVLLRWTQTWVNSEAAITPRLSWWVGLSIGLIYALVGWYFTSAVGAHSGDEGHYIIQAESLFSTMTWTLGIT
jgi:hypothetical protein